MNPSNERNLSPLAKIAALAIRHRRLVAIAWVVVLVGAFAISSAVGTNYSKDFSLPGTESQRAVDLLKANFPAQSGDQDRIVFAGSGSDAKVTDPQQRAKIEAVLGKVAKLPHVTAVESPYGGTDAISANGQIAFATVNFDEAASALPHSSVEAVMSTAEAVGSDDLEVDFGGQAIEQVEKAAPSGTLLIGIVAAMVVLFITFGSLVATGLPLVTALLGLGTGVSLIGIATHIVGTPEFATELALMIGLGVGVDYALFIVTRFRENYQETGDVDGSVIAAIDTAGRAVLFAGITVIIALLGMFALGVGILQGLGVAASLGVAMTMLAALTVLPVMLSRFGERVGRPSRRRRAKAKPAATGPGIWERWAGTVQRHPWMAMFAALAIMLTLAVPALSLRLGTSDAGNGPSTLTTKRAYDLLGEGFGKGFNGPLQVVASFQGKPSSASLAEIDDELKGHADVASVLPPMTSPDGQTAIFEVYPKSSPQDAATTDLVNEIRDTTAPALERATQADIVVGGATASGVDFSKVLSEKLPLFIAIVVLLSALLLLIVFRSLLIPLQAALMNLLSIGASLGIVVAVFQNGWLGGLIGVSPGPIDAFIPVLLFAIVFGLSMDYEVFLVSRIHEGWVQRRDASAAIRQGVGSTGRVITAAATIMILVFASFALGDERVLKLFGVSLASAVFLDAFVIRMLLLPAVLELLGERTWKLPGRLDRFLPHLAIDKPAEQPEKQLVTDAG